MFELEELKQKSLAVKLGILPVYGEEDVNYMHTGEDHPGLEVDHINNVRSDNNPENLRWVNRSQNSGNRPPAHIRSNRPLSQTGYRCVYPIKTGGFSAVTPGPDGQKYLGYYKNP